MSIMTVADVVRTLEPRAIAKEYAQGRLDRETMIEALGTYPYDADSATDGYDWLPTEPASGPTWSDVVSALHRGDITLDDYEAILERNESLLA